MKNDLFYLGHIALRKSVYLDGQQRGQMGTQMSNYCQRVLFIYQAHLLFFVFVYVG